MKKLTMGTMSILLGLAPVTHAGVEDGQFAVLKTEKSCLIKTPEGLSESQVYFSKDCSTAYIMPPLKMKAQVSTPIFLAGANDKFCAAMDALAGSEVQYRNAIADLNRHIDKVYDQMDNATPEQRASLQLEADGMEKRINSYKTQITEIFKPYDTMSALRVQFTVTNDVMDSIKAFQAANAEVGPDEEKLYPVRFMPAQIAESVLAISNPDSDSYMGRTVLKANFPGFSVNPKEGRTQDPNATHIQMNGSMSGIVDISTSVYCKNRDRSANLNELLSHAIALNMNYDVKVQTGAKLFIDAKIETKNFLRNLSDVIQNGKYNHNEFMDTMVTGGLKNGIRIVVDDKGGDYDLNSLLTGKEEDPNISPIIPLVSKVISNYVSRAEDKLEQLGVFTKTVPPHAKEVQPGVENVHVADKTVCSSSSSWFGIVRSSHCDTYPIYVPVDHDGLSRLADSVQDDSFIEEQVEFEINQTSTVQHTSTFVY